MADRLPSGKSPKAIAITGGGSVVGDADGFGDQHRAVAALQFHRAFVGDAGAAVLHRFDRLHREAQANAPANRVRFTGMVPAGSRIRLRLTVKAVETTRDGGTRITNEGTMELEGSDRPVLVAETIGVTYD